MATLTSKDLGTSNRPSIRLFAPPGGHSNIIFGDEGDDKQQKNQNESDIVGSTINQNYQPSQQLSPFTNQQPHPDYYDSLTNVQRQQPQSRMSPINQNLKYSLPVSPSPVRNQFDSNNRPNNLINNNDQGLTMQQKVLGTTSSNLNSYALPSYNYSSNNNNTNNNPNNYNINYNTNGISETVYLEILAESMFQNGQTTVNQLDELSHEIMSLSKQCFIVASVCKQNDDTLNNTNIKMNTATNNNKFATSGSSNSSSSSNINSTVAKGYEDDVNDLIPSVASSIIDHASKLLETYLFVALKDSSDATTTLNSNNYDSSSNSNNQSNDSASILINQLASIITQLKRLQIYHYQQVNNENEIVTTRRYEVYQLIGECLQTICSHVQTLKSNIMTLQLQAEQFSLNLEVANSNKNDANTNNRSTPSTTHSDINYNNNNTPLRNNNLNNMNNYNNNKSLNNSSSSSAIKLSMSQELNEIRRIKLQQEQEEERRKQEINALAPLATLVTNKVVKVIDTATSRRVKETFDYLKQYNEEYKSRQNQISSFLNTLTPLLSKYWFKQLSRRFHQWNRVTLQLAQLATADKYMKEMKVVPPLLQVPLTSSSKSASPSIVPSFSTIQPAHSSNNTDNNKSPLAVSSSSSSSGLDKSGNTNTIDHNKKIEELEEQIVALQTLYSASINPHKQQLKTNSDTDEQEDVDELLRRRNDRDKDSDRNSSDRNNSSSKGSGRQSIRSDKNDAVNDTKLTSLLSSPPPLPPSSSSSSLSSAEQLPFEAILPPPLPPSSLCSSTPFPSSSPSQALTGKNIVIKNNQETLMMLSFELERLGMKVTQLEKENSELKQQLLKKK